MNYIDYHKPDTKAGELMKKEIPLQKIDYVHHRKTDRLPERQDGAGALYWLVVAATCWIVIIALCASAGYFD
jgi:hypothetical protein